MRYNGGYNGKRDNIKLILKISLSSDYFLQLERMKEELPVIAYHKGAVNMFWSFVQTARHGLKGGSPQGDLLLY